jgi:integrase/recombinase XerD
MMHRHLDRYINLHRALGKEFIKHEKSLREFAAFADDRSDLHVTAALILAWAGSAATPNSARNRYDQARAFAMFLHAECVFRLMAGSDFRG